MLSLPILDGGRNQAAVDRAQAALEGAVADYRQRVLAAFADVEDSLATLRAVRGQAKIIDDLLDLSRVALTFFRG